MTDANAVLNTLTASNIFDLRGVVAVVTGGGTVSARLYIQRIDLTIRFCRARLPGNWANDKFYADGEWGDCLYCRA